MGGFDRLRVSSQSLKRAWRTSEIFEQIVSAEEKIKIFDKEFPVNIGFRSKVFADKWLSNLLVKNGINAELAEKWSGDFSRAYGQMEKEENKLSQLSHISDLEAQGLYYMSLELVEYLKNKKPNELFDKIKEIQANRATKKKADDIKKLNDKITDSLSSQFLNKGKTSTDIALFGRMLASSPAYNVEAACQVAHAISVHPVMIEDDYFTAVDDLNDGSQDAGAAHIGETGFAAGLFYSYICINRELLVDNLGGDKELAMKAIKALTEAAVKVSPDGKQNSFASRAYASYILAEKGDQQPRSLSVAFLKPVTSQGIEGADFGEASVKALTCQQKNMDKVYGSCADSRFYIDAINGNGGYYPPSPEPQCKLSDESPDDKTTLLEKLLTFVAE
jgi:CRISPR system Cascade subunit CasC